MTGAAIARPERRVVALEADGSALYTIQALWTQAREGLTSPMSFSTTAFYAILRLEMIAPASINCPRANALFDPEAPRDRLLQHRARFGVPAERGNTCVTAALTRSYASPWSRTIEVMIR